MGLSVGGNPARAQNAHNQREQSAKPKEEAGEENFCGTHFHNSFLVQATPTRQSMISLSDQTCSEPMRKSQEG